MADNGDGGVEAGEPFAQGSKGITALRCQRGVVRVEPLREEDTHRACPPLEDDTWAGDLAFDQDELRGQGGRVE